MSAERERLHYWLALNHAPGVGAVTFKQLLEQYGTPEQLFLSPEVIPDSTLRAYLQRPDWEAVERDLEWLSGDGCYILSLADPRYPPLLHDIADPPPLLFVRGEPDLLSQPQLAMVGSRNPTVSGRETAHDFARTLAAAGLVISSGLALGVDEASHRGALAAAGQTIAVCGTGLNRVYPAANRDLAHAIIAEGGALVSEYPPGTPPLAGNFPRRNRIISGLSLGTLVVEAALRSGSLITARQAAEQGREVFAIPGSIHNPLARGCHRLIRDGAKLVEEARDVLEELAPQLRVIVEMPVSSVEGAAAEGELDAGLRALLACVGDEPTPVDRLVERSGLTAGAVSSMLLNLELHGHVASTAGGYMRTGKRS